MVKKKEKKEKQFPLNYKQQFLLLSPVSFVSQKEILDS